MTISVASGRNYLLGLVVQLLALPSHGADFKLAADTITGSFKNRLSVGAGMRTNKPSRHLLGKGFDSAGRPKGGDGADTADDGNLNYRRGDVYTAPLKLVSELRLQYQQSGIDLSSRTWYDPSLKFDHVEQGNNASHFAAHRPLSDRRFDKANRFSGFMLLNAYAFTRFDFAKEQALDLRLGKQTLNWGEDLFVQNIDQINPRDYTNLHRPGTDATSELRLPVEMLWSRWTLSPAFSVEGFYQWKWRPSEYDPCGTFFSASDLGFDPGCANIQTNAYYPMNAYTPGAGRWLSDGYMESVGAILPGSPRRRGRNSGQWGAALHYRVAAVHTDFGLYYMNINARNPYFDSSSLDPTQQRAGLAERLIAAGVPASNAQLSQRLSSIHTGWEYPNNIRIAGLSAATQLGAWRLAGEVSYSSHLPIQINTSDMFAAISRNGGPISQRAASLAPGQMLRGYDRFDKTQWQFNIKRKFDQPLGAESGQFAAELVWSHANLPALGQARYGRAFAWGFSPQYSDGSCSPVQNPQGCVSKGFYTRQAWAYRLRGQLDYAMPGHWTLCPNLLWGQDVRGYSVDNQIVRGRKLLILGLTAKWRRYELTFNYNSWVDQAPYDTLKDHDFVSLALIGNF